MTELATVAGGAEERPKLLQRRVDWLTVAYRVELDDQQIAYLESRAELAAEHGRADVELVDPSGRALLFCMKRTRAPRRWYLENAECRIVVDLEAAGRFTSPPPASELVPGWTVEITPFAVYLATHELEETLGLMRDTAAAFGRMLAERLRRVDLAADFEGWKLDRDDATSWVKHPRAHLYAFQDLADPNRDATEEHDPANPERPKLHYVQGNFTGFTIGQGGPVRLRLYDKTRELADVPNEAKEAIEHQQWTKAEWSGGTVVRLEFQIRGEALDELKAREPSELADKLDPIWQYLARRWARLVVPGTASRLSRCKLAPQWRAAQAVTFKHANAEPCPRVRCRGACSFDQLFGSLCSYLAAEGMTSGIADKFRAAGPELQVAAALTDQERAAFLRSLADELGGHLSQALQTVWLRNPRASVVRTLTTVRAYRARYAQAPPKKRRERPG